MTQNATKSIQLIFYVFFSQQKAAWKVISIKENPLRHHLNGNQSPKLTKNEALDLIFKWFYPNLGFITKVWRFQTESWHCKIESFKVEIQKVDFFCRVVDIPSRRKGVFKVDLSRSLKWQTSAFVDFSALSFEQNGFCQNLL